jgi:hypothetical protein
VTLVNLPTSNMSWPRDLISNVTTYFSIMYLLITLRKGFKNPSQTGNIHFDYGKK